MTTPLDTLAANAASPADNTPRVKGKNDQEKIKDAARQFEALMLEQMLKSMREAGGSGWMGTGDDKAGESMMDVAEQQFAKAIASNGGLGIASLVARGLDRPVSTDSGSAKSHR